MPVDEYVLHRGPPTAEEYVHLRRAAGLHSKTLDQARRTFAGSWAFRHVRRDDEAVAMGRLVGDDAWYFALADLAVLPAHQRRGLGGRVLDALLAELQERVPGAYVTLVADGPGVGLYRSRGFRDVGSPYSAMERKIGAL